MYVALELAQAKWQIGSTVSAGERPRVQTIRAGDMPALARELAAAKVRWGLAEDVPVVSGYEAGRDGFWVHRWLVHGADNHVRDASSMRCGVGRGARGPIGSIWAGCCAC